MMIVKKHIPDDVYALIVTFLGPNDDVRRSFDACTSRIPCARNHMKRCTPCEKCNVRKTYSKLCRHCDINQWWDIPCTYELNALCGEYARCTKCAAFVFLTKTKCKRLVIRFKACQTRISSTKPKRCACCALNHRSDAMRSTKVDVFNFAFSR